jgi:hypothetical protein
MVSTLPDSQILPHLLRCPLTFHEKATALIKCSHNLLILQPTLVQARHTAQDSHPCRRKGHIALYRHHRQLITHHLPPDYPLHIHLPSTNRCTIPICKICSIRSVPKPLPCRLCNGSMTSSSALSHGPRFAALL